MGIKAESRLLYKVPFDKIRVLRKKKHVFPKRNHLPPFMVIVFVEHQVEVLPHQNTSTD